MKRRTLLKTSLAASAVAAAGSVIPGRVLAAYPKAAFESQERFGRAVHRIRYWIISMA